MAGLFLPCIRPGAGLFFCPDAIQPHTSVYSGFCAVNAIIPPTPQNSTQGFTVDFPAITPIQPPQIPDRQKRLLYHLRHAGASASTRTPCTDTRYHRHAGTLYRPAQPPIIIMYIRGQTMPARQGQLLPCVDRWQVLTRCQQYRPGAPADGPAQRDSPAAGSTAGGAEPLAASAASLFELSPDS